MIYKLILSVLRRNNVTPYFYLNVFLETFKRLATMFIMKDLYIRFKYILQNIVLWTSLGGGSLLKEAR